MRFLLSFLAVACVASAQAPRLTFNDGSQRRALAVQAVAVDVTLTGDVAETRFTLTYRNDTDRVLEGEFIMPLPDGATVSSYALEIVKGALRESVSVERKQAREAYEAIKRQMIDPGLVEREANNVYRTRVFPIPANDTKKMRIGYVEPLAWRDGVRVYTLPLAFDPESRHDLLHSKEVDRPTLRLRVLRATGLATSVLSRISRISVADQEA